VRGLSLSVEPGEVFGLLGPNGAGKTSTVKMLLGLVRPSAGQVWVLGRPPDVAEARRRVGFLPEHFQFPGWLKVTEVLEYHGRLYGQPAKVAARRAGPLLERVGLEGRGGSRVRELSKGMVQRLGLAQALMNDPAVVVLDEPTSGLDPIGRMLVRAIVRELAGQGVAVLINSHLLGEVEAVCDRVGIMSRGRMRLFGPPESLPGRVPEVEIAFTGLAPSAVAGLGEPFDAAASVGEMIVVPLSGTEPEPHEIGGLVSRLVAAGADVYSVRPRRLTLEEVFVGIAGNEAD
jgi:ABC-2 type transport system ATP-binding protein